MYDTVCIWLETQKPHAICAKLKDAHEITDKKTGQIKEIGKINNFKIKINGNKVRLKGSLSRFYLGSNLNNMPFSSTPHAIEKLSDVIEENLQAAVVTQMDLAYNIPIQFHISNYLRSMGTLDLFTQNIWDDYTTLAYRNSLKEIVFYDKILEAQKKYRAIPTAFCNTNLLRYELRFMKRLRATLDQTYQITVPQLYDPSLNYILLRHWVDQYRQIPKTSIPDFGHIPSTGSDLITACTAWGIHHLGGASAAFDHFRSLPCGQNLDTQQRYRLKKKLLKIGGKNGQIGYHSICTEIDNKVQSIFDEQVADINLLKGRK